MKKKYIVEGMSCTACSASVERVVNKISGVNSATVNLIAKLLYVDFDESIVSDIDIFNAVKKAGFSIKEENNIFNKKIDYKETKEIESNGKYPSVKTRLIVSFVLLIPLMYISMGHMINMPLPSFMSKNENPLIYALSQMVLVIPILIINRKFFVNGVKGVIHLAPNMDTLVSLGSLISFIYGIIAIFFIAFGSEELAIKYVSNLYFDSSAMILSLITIGKALEEKAKSKTNELVESLKKLTPNTVTVLKDGKEEVVSLDSVNVTDKIVLKAGEISPIDGTILSGKSYVNESAITGESMPVSKDVHDNIISGSIVLDGYLIVEVVKSGENTTLNKIIDCVRNAGATKAKAQRLADRISAYFVPTVILISIIAFIVWIITKNDVEMALFHSIQVLVISCPCALGLATPVAVTASIGASAKEGILIKNAESFEILNEVDTIIFDKTGTLTYGVPYVDKIIKNDGVNENELLKIVRTLESKSNHPIANAILEYTKSVEEYILESYGVLAGEGVKGVYDGVEILIGNKRLMNENNIDINMGIDDYDGTILYVSKSGKMIGIIAIKDKIKETSKDGVALLKQKGIYVSMLSGDSFNSCNKVKDALDIDIAYDSVLPIDKERIVSEVIDSGRTVMFVGDGINDSPALSRSSIGVSISSATDIAIDSSSVVLLKDDIRDINKIINISKRTVKIIKENLFWAFLYNIICIPIAAGALSFVGINLTPILASLSMSISSLIVVTNALRLKKIKER